MEKKEFKAGQTVYLKIIEGSNRARDLSDKLNIENWIIEKVVTKVGNKYIFVANSEDTRYGEEKFDVTNDFGHVYTYGGQDYELYLSKEDIINDLESEKLYSEIKTRFNNWKNKRKYTLEQLKSVLDILENKSNKKVIL